MVSILDDPALRISPNLPALGQKVPTFGSEVPRLRVRFRPDSAFARDFYLPPETSGTIDGRYERDGRRLANMLIEGVPGVGYASGVPVEELREV